MAGPIVGSIEHLTGINGATGSIQSQFVNLYRFFLNASSSLGITRLAYNTGSAPIGTAANSIRAMNYHDEGLPAGPNAWAAFRFSNAVIPFDMLMQWTPNGTATGASPATPASASATNSTTAHFLLFSFAQRLDGTTAWAGTTLNNGQDNKANTVWTTGSNVATLFCPRSNSPVGAGQTNVQRANMGVLVGDTNANAVAIRMSAVADYDNVAVVADVSNDSTYNIVYFGKLLPISGSSVEIPYYGFMDRATAAFPATAQAYGLAAGTGNFEGGIMFPSASLSGTLSAGFDRLGTTLYQTINAQPNRAYSVPTFNEFPLNVGMLEDADRTGLIGQSDFIREMYGVQIHDTNSDGTRAVFGGATAVANIKVTIPWHSGTTPGTGVSRTGVQFSNP